MRIQVGSEIGTLRSLIIHSPDSGIGRVAPSRAQDWLFEDILHLETVRKNEYDFYVKLLMYFLDPGKIKGKLESIDSPENKRGFFIPGRPDFHSSDKVIEIEQLLAQILEDNDIKKTLIASICAVENCSYRLQEKLAASSPAELARSFISGADNEGNMLFPPIPNFIFTRDIGISINNYILLNKPAKKARTRETLLAKYIFFNHPVFQHYRDNILEIPGTLSHILKSGDDSRENPTIEGGDVMVVSNNHVLIGVSERTSASGASEAVKLLFERNVVNKVTIVKIPQKRDYMHIDTLFTQIKRNLWVVLHSITSKEQNKGSEVIDYISKKRNQEKPEIIQFRKDNMEHPLNYPCIEDLLEDISKNDLQCKEKTEFILAGNNIFPFDVREQWTDACNLLALKEGVVLGYDRNDKTLQAFKQKGFTLITVQELIEKFEYEDLDPQKLENTLILMPSGELSRARGGFHCMSMPLWREEV